MARASNRAGSSESGSGPEGGRNAATSKGGAGGATRADAGPRSLATWLEEAWHGWMKSVGGLILTLAAYLLYSGGYLPELPAGRAVLALIIGGTVYLAIEPALERFSDARRRYLLIGFAVVWALVAAAPLFRTAFPDKVLAETVLTKDTSGAVVNIEGGDKAPYEVSVFGRLRGSGEVDVPYEIELAGDGDSSARFEGELKRTYFNQRVSRRSAGTVAVKTENTETSHRVSGVRGAQIKVSGQVGGDALEDGLHLVFRRAGPHPLILFGVGLLLVIAGIVFDYRTVSSKADRTQLSTATGFTLAFSTYYPMEATPHNLVRPAIAALLVGLGLGALLAWGASAIVLSFRPRPKKLAGVKNKFADDE